MTDRFLVQREYAASADRVFRAWTDVSVLRQWFGCGIPIDGLSSRMIAGNELTGAEPWR